MDTYLQAGLDALGDQTRMAIFQKLAAGPVAVNELSRKLPVTRPAVSQHLKVLKNAGLVTDTRQGARRLYRLSPEGIARLRAHFDQLWDKAMRNFQSAAEKSPQPMPQKKSQVKGEKHAHVRRRSRRS